MQELADDYLAAEPAIVAALAPVPGLRKVYVSQDLADMAENSQITPAAHVIYFGDRVQDNAQGGVMGHADQTWLVILAVHQVRDGNKAGPLIAALLKTLCGHHGPLGNLTRANAPKPYFSGGFGYYPLAFNLKFRTKANR
uniref:phage tail terminator protein n=1 Tax=Marinobacterium profundum TaxID=1714300 RepID=UPI00082B20A8|nr:hypothetical protein [Marinobacterium profundum]